MKIKRMHDITLEVIRLINNTGALIAEVDATINPIVFNMPYGLVMSQRAELGLPPVESAGRIKRKILTEHPEMVPDANVQAQRELLQEEFKKYARDLS